MSDPTTADESGSAGRGARRWLAAVGLLMLVAVGLVYGRALLESKAALERGDALESTELEAAIVAWRHAVEWYAPGNPWSREAVERLRRVGLGTDAPGDRDQALLALESLRTAILLTRHVTTPYAETLEPVERRIAELRGAEAAARTGQPLGVEVDRQYELLVASRERAPRPVWSLVTVLAFVAWIGVTWRGLARAYDDEGRLVARRALLYGSASMLALGTWLVGLSLV